MDSFDAAGVSNLSYRRSRDVNIPIYVRIRAVSVGRKAALTSIISPYALHVRAGTLRGVLPQYNDAGRPGTAEGEDLTATEPPTQEFNASPKIPMTATVFIARASRLTLQS